MFELIRANGRDAGRPAGWAFEDNMLRWHSREG